MENISVTRNHKQVLKSFSALRTIPDSSSSDFTVSIVSTGAILLHNAYLYHAQFRAAGVVQAIRNFVIDTYPITTLAAEYLLNDPYTWIRASVPHFWDQGLMAKGSISFIMRLTNGSGGQIIVSLICYALIELTSACQITMTVV